jgi:hypothetical protein
MSIDKKKSLEIAIEALEEEVSNIRADRDKSYSDNVKDSLNGQILSFIMCIQHLRDLIEDEQNQDI